MPANIITTDDLREFKIELLSELKQLLSSQNNFTHDQKKYLRSSEVTKELGISTSTLQHLRIKKIIPFTKIGATIFYDWQDIKKILDQNKKMAKVNPSFSLFKI